MAKKYKKQVIKPDIIYNDVTVAKFINQVMKGGKKITARKLVYGAFDILKEKTKQEPLDVFDLAIKNASPLLEVKPKRIGGATYQVPREVKGDRKLTLAIRWIIQATKSKKGVSFKEKLAEEIMNAANNTGSAVRKRRHSQDGRS